MKKKILFILVLVLTINLVGCQQKNTKNEKLVISFLEEYYGQYNLSQKEWADISYESLKKSGLISENGEFIKNSEGLENIAYLNQYSDYLTNHFINELISSKKLPNYYMKDIKIDSFSFENLNLDHVKDNQYRLNYLLNLKKDDKVTSEEKELLISFVKDIKQDKLLIDDISGKIE